MEWCGQLGELEEHYHLISPCMEVALSFEFVQSVYLSWLLRMWDGLIQ